VLCGAPCAGAGPQQVATALARHHHCWLTLDGRWQRLDGRATHAGSEQLAVEHDALSRLHRFTLRLIGEESLSLIYQALLDAALSLAAAPIGTVQRYDPASSSLEVVAHRGADAALLAQLSVSRPLSRLEPDALVGRDRVFLEDAAHSRFLAEASQKTLLAEGVRSVLGVWLVSRDGGPLGLLSLYFKGARRLDDQALRLFDLLARQAADVIERRERERTLAETQATLRSFYDSSPFMMGVLELDGETLVVEHGNLATARLQGVPVPGLAGLSFDALGFSPENQELWLQMCRKARVTNEPARFEFEVHLPGHAVWLDATLSPMEPGASGRERFSYFASDITERKALYETLHVTAETSRRRADEWRQLMDVAPIAIWVAQDASCEVVTRNQAAKSLYGGESPVSYWHDGRRLESHELPLQRAAATGESTRGLELEVHLGSGRVVTIEGNASPLFGDRGQVRGAIGAFADVTRRKDIERELRDADRHKNEFLALLSHELRNPLAPIRNGLHLLEASGLPPGSARRAVDVLRRQTGLLTRLVDDLLDVTRVSRGRITLQKKKLELGPLLRQVLEDHQEQFGAMGVRLQSALPERPVLVEADASRLTQVIANLLSNAVRFSTRGGTTRVSLAVEEGPWAVLTVSDDGQGIPPELQARLFEPFVQGEVKLDRAKGGLGLGLALVKGLVALHGGSVSVSSSGRGTGATFAVRLPVASGVALDAPAPEPVRAVRRSVLLIEDNADAAETLQELLKLWGHDVALARSGPEGLSKARDLLPHVVVCDLGLPGTDGFTVARALRAEPLLAHAVLIALSGYALPADVQRATESGFDHHLAKPPDLARLAALIAQAPSPPAPPMPSAPRPRAPI
jgi:PAS domain S-box-containing protein